jgi:L-asparaginase / beta-aspartyl-peptidase
MPKLIRKQPGRHINLSRIIVIHIFLIFYSCNYQNNSESSENVRFTPTLVIHGGAGTITRENIDPEMEAQIRNKMEEALKTGYAILEKGGASTEAIIRTIQVMEESPLFNAGRGAVFTYDETNELDAAIMEGKTGRAGAVAGVSRIKSPIEAAYTVMTNSEHVLLTGRGAEEFAALNGLEIVDPSYFFTEKRYRQLLKRKESERGELKKDKKTSSAINNKSDFIFGTVGAVAIDKNGNLAAGTSTGGMTNKRFGRVGDVPIIGAGTYADNATCAVSATGHGEFFIRNVVAYDIAARIKYQDKNLETAANEVIEELRLKEGFGGVICLDREGNFCMPFNTEGMYRGCKKEGEKVQVHLFGSEDKLN